MPSTLSLGTAEPSSTIIVSRAGGDRLVQSVSISPFNAVRDAAPPAQGQGLNQKFCRETTRNVYAPRLLPLMPRRPIRAIRSTPSQGHAAVAARASILRRRL